MATMTKYAKWMTENAASIHTGNYSGKNKAGNPVSGNYAIIYDNKTNQPWVNARAAELDVAISAAIEKTKTVQRPLHEADANANELVAARARIAELEKELGKPAPAKPVVDEESEISGPVGMSIEQASKARLKK
jgi:hypothetical protein